jgi:hypothetical protein
MSQSNTRGDRPIPATAAGSLSPVCNWCKPLIEHPLPVLQRRLTASL